MKGNIDGSSTVKYGLEEAMNYDGQDHPKSLSTHSHHFPMINKQAMTSLINVSKTQVRAMSSIKNTLGTDFHIQKPNFFSNDIVD